MQPITTQGVLFQSVFSKPVHALFDQPHASSDGGAVLLKAADRRVGLIARLAAALPDHRQPGKVAHTLGELLSQRIYGLACGYADGNDAARLACDPVHKFLLDRDPVSGADLASQPTLSRLENGLNRSDLLRFGLALLDTVVDHHSRRLRRKCRRITVDLDPTDNPTHGAQQLTFFNGHYDTWCYLPMVAFLTFDDEPDQYLCSAVLRPGNAPVRNGAVGLLSRILPRLRAAFPGTEILVRLDGGFAVPEILDFLSEQPDVLYVVGMPSNSRLERKAARFLREARQRFRAEQETCRVYGAFSYAAKTWHCQRWIVVKAEVLAYEGRRPKNNPRFVVTNLYQEPPQRVYEELYCGRAHIENRIKELHDSLGFGRTSCSRFLANQFRILLSAAAFVLMQEVRRAAATTSKAGLQAATIRDHLLKIGVRVVASVRRIIFHLPDSFPFREPWMQIARALGATAG